tara:strand:+ start:1067 stop:1291 length:225 start_codon:yes stop_codon:yes gene_type:complete
MIVTTETDLTNFNFWSGAKQHAFNYSELKELAFSLEDLFHEKPPTDTQINDLFWFEDEFLCECIGLDFEEYQER